jgi:hypothetical protein
LQARNDGVCRESERAQCDLSPRLTRSAPIYFTHRLPTLWDKREHRFRMRADFARHLERLSSMRIPIAPK